MNLKSIYTSLENSYEEDNFSLIHKDINSYIFNNPNIYKEILNEDLKYLRYMFIMPINILDYKKILKLLENEINLKTFTAHCILIKLSFELYNENNLKDDLYNFFYDFTKVVKKIKLDRCGTTLSIGFGFLLSSFIKNGINVNDIFELFDDSFIIDQKFLYTGIKEGFKLTETNLLNNKIYKEGYIDRYSNQWNITSQNISLKLAKELKPNFKLAKYNYNEDNLSVLNYFYYTFKEESYKKDLINYKKEKNNKSTSTDNNLLSNNNVKEENKKLKNKLLLNDLFVDEIIKLYPEIKNILLNQNEEKLIKELKIFIDNKKEELLLLENISKKYNEKENKNKKLKSLL